MEEEKTYKGQLPVDGKCRCDKCGKTMAKIKFYTYPDKSNSKLCKECLTMHIDNFNPETYVWLLKEFDVPYIPSEWNSLRDAAFAKDPKKMNGMSVFGKYLSKMKLNQWSKFTWADTERLQAEEEAKAAERADEIAAQKEYLQQRYDAGEISEAEYKTLMSTEVQKEEYYKKAAAAAGSQEANVGENNAYDEGAFINPNDLPDPAAELTDEDKVYLAMKWGTLYRPSEWVELERMYVEMEDSFDIQDADSRATLVLLCKTNLKANQAIDSGDFDGYQKLAKVSESLRKTAKFTAAQNKEEKGDVVDSVGELVAMCEREGGFIPRYVTDIPQDVVDITLKDMQEYTRRLVTEDLGLGQQIEDAIKKFQIQQEAANEVAAKAAANDEDADDDFGITDADLEALYSDISEQQDADEVASLGEEALL